MELQFQIVSFPFEPPAFSNIAMLQFACDIVRTTHLGKLQEICFHFTEQTSLDLYDWYTKPTVSEKVASLEEVVISTSSKTKITFNIPSLKPLHADTIFETARRLFPRVDQGGNLFMSPTGE